MTGYIFLKFKNIILSLIKITFSTFNILQTQIIQFSFSFINSNQTLLQDT